MHSCEIEENTPLINKLKCRKSKKSKNYAVSSLRFQNKLYVSLCLEDRYIFKA